MKKLLKIIGCIAVINSLLLMSGCADSSALEDVKSVLNLNKGFIVFDTTKVSKEEVLAYESPYKDMTTSYFKDQLSEEEKTLYQAYIYAYEHGYSKIYFYSDDEKLGDKFELVMQSLCSENPFFDWNYNFQNRYDPIKKCYVILVEGLEAKDFKLKLEAYNKAKELIKEIPSDASEYDKVEWIYNYVVNNISYVDDLEAYLANSPSYVYDGLIKGATQCSGFADTITMMCNLAGIETLTIPGETDQGHAWNLIKLDNKYYHSDATNDRSLKDVIESDDEIWLSFLRSDKYIFSNGYSLAKNLLIDFPKAEDSKYDTDGINLITETITNENDIKIIGDALISNKKYIVVQSQEIGSIGTAELNTALDSILQYVCSNIELDRQAMISLNSSSNPSNKTLIIYLMIEDM